MTAAEHSKTYHHRKPPRRGRRSAVNDRQGAKHVPRGRRMVPSCDPSLAGILSRIGKPEPLPFVPDPFQMEALEALSVSDCLVVAPTGSGKTWIAEKAIQAIYERGGRAWYASPLKALTNAKWVEFGDIFGSEQVGILTGDTKENSEAPIITGTTEILRNQLYDAMHHGEDLDFDLVILDEAHYLGDEDRGVVWEEIMMYLPRRVRLLLLSATIGNSDEIAGWLGGLRDRQCIVVKESGRPVLLVPIFLTPTGILMPLLKERRLYPGIPSSGSEDKQGSDRRSRFMPPPFDDIISVLRTFNLLPAIFFLKSRQECDNAVTRIKTSSSRTDEFLFDEDSRSILERFPFLKKHRQLIHLRRSRVAAHHGGQLPAWKFMVERMMKGGHLEAVFATTTVAAGVNFPARTVVLFNSDQFNGHDFLPLTATAFHQMTGRAGRRGLDRIGFMLAYPGRFMDLSLMRDLYYRKPEKILSRIRNDFSMILNLLLSHTPREIRDIFEMSFADYQNPGKKRGMKNLKKEFDRYLLFLKNEGFVNGAGKLTEDGIWASRLRLDQPLLIAECLRNRAFPENDEPLLAAVIANFVYDRNQDIPLYKRQVPKRVRRACNRIFRTIAPLVERMESAGFDVTPLRLWPAVAIYHWARGMDWDELTESMRVADGDLAMLISRTADNLNQLADLRESHPIIAERAALAKQIILREPVVFGPETE
ncbi:MAG: DEAD/DEAH box helicase [Deltaproteobacteria bacterium]|nr:DEAD/DEAH box helicase [Deltaproteobacteria bacterium]